MREYYLLLPSDSPKCIGTSLITISISAGYIPLVVLGVVQVIHDSLLLALLDYSHTPALLLVFTILLTSLF